MNRIRTRLATVLALAVGLGLGWLAGYQRPARLRAESSTRSGESIAVAGPIAIQPTLQKMQAPLDAAYWLDYGGARLYATLPAAGKTYRDIRILGDVATRDLIDDFGLKAMTPGTQPHFLMNSISLGGLGQGSSVLTVVETTTRRIAAYRASEKSVGIDRKAELTLLQVLSYGRPGATPDDGSRPGQTLSVVGPIVLEQTPGDRFQVPLDALYWLENRPAPEQGAKLYATTPSVRKTGGAESAISPPAERDLVADFKLPAASTPNFLMTTSSLGGAMKGAAVLIVIETTTKQVAAYMTVPRATVADSKPAMNLIQIKPYVDLPPLPVTSGN